MWRYCVNIWRRRVGGPGRWWSCNGLTRSNSRPCKEALMFTRSTIPNENTTVDSSARLDTLSNICSKTPRSQNIFKAELATGFTQQWFKCVSDNWKRMFHPMQMQKSNGSPLQSTCIPLASRHTLSSHVASVCRRWRHKVFITTSDKQLKQSRQYRCVCVYRRTSRWWRSDGASESTTASTSSRPSSWTSPRKRYGYMSTSHDTVTSFFHLCSYTTSVLIIQ